MGLWRPGLRAEGNVARRDLMAGRGLHTKIYAAEEALEPGIARSKARIGAPCSPICAIGWASKPTKWKPPIPVKHAPAVAMSIAISAGERNSTAVSAAAGCTPTLTTLGI